MTRSSATLLPDGAAAKAGIQEGDQVVQIDDSQIPTGKISR